MIPVKLSLRNFMCYRDNVPPISFESIHTACISGDNGHGKSALIDAITWALWGQTRATSDDDLVHSGQTEVEVDFEFDIGSQRYRIIRKHSRPKTSKRSGQTILEFQAVTPDGYKVLSGDNSTQTQHKITQLLHMDYDTFINSAFIRQGRADEFTKKRPGERKQVLGNILQLSVYDELEDRAKEKAKALDNDIIKAETEIDSLHKELMQKPDYLNEFEQAQKDLAEAESKTKEQENRLVFLRKDKELLENKKTRLKELSAHAQDTERNYKLWSEQAKQCQDRINGYETLIAQREAIEDQYRQFLEVRKTNLELDQKLKQVNSLTGEKHRLEIAVVKAGENLNRSHAIAESRIRDLEAISGKLPHLHEEMKQIVSTLRNLEDAEVKIKEKQENSKLLHARVHHLQAEKTRLLQEINDVEDKLKLMSRQHEGGITCPLCESDLGEEGRKRIETKYISEKAAKNDALKLIQKELSEKEAEVRSLENDVMQSETKLRNAKEAAQSRYGNIHKAISDAEDAEKKAKEERLLLDDIERRLAGRDFAVNEQAMLAQLEKEIADIGYNSQQHDQARARLAELEKFEASKRRLEEAERLILQEKENAAKACQTAEELFNKLEGDRQLQESLLIEISNSSGVTEALSQAEMEYQNLQSRQKRIQEVIGGIKAQLERFAKLETLKKEKESELAQAVNQVKIYKDLAQAFGKKGIQATLIEMAIPEIEAEANKLLSRMTDNRMHIKMESQRETRKGDVVETLDINISDELGMRNYEMFSGGESFRIDFAIRIALSKLLARRAGAPLPTLIIDEGFGTQDSTGIEKIKEAITSIQDDFDKILVITHIIDFKDAFPLRIEVVKTPEGSTVYLN